MAQHTKGPWRIKQNPRHSQDECDLTICGDIFMLADINGPNYEHQEANARLIAAAPELFEALRNLADNVEHAFPALAHLGPLVAARAALAKATGAA